MLSFGHAAHCRLGADAHRLDAAYLLPNTLARIAVGVLANVAAAKVLGLVITRSRSIRFAMLTVSFRRAYYFRIADYPAISGQALPPGLLNATAPGIVRTNL